MAAAPQLRAAPTPSASASPSLLRRWGFGIVVTLLILSGLTTLGYTGVSTYMATQLVYAAPKAVRQTPAALGLTYRDVTFSARDDGVRIRGWFIPGVLPDGRLTADRTLIMVHGWPGNREDNDPKEGVGILDLSAALAHEGFAVLTFDQRGAGESPPAPFSFGYFEQRDVLGVVDLLRKGALPYPELGRPRAIGGWAVSMGSSSLIYAASREPAIQAVVTNCAFAELAPMLEYQLPQRSGLPPAFTPGMALAARALYGIDYYSIRPVDVVGRLAPRPLYLIHVTNDAIIPTGHMDILAAAARASSVPVQSWRIPDGQHCNTFRLMRGEYVQRMVAFYTAALGPDATSARLATAPRASRLRGR